MLFLVKRSWHSGLAALALLTLLGLGLRHILADVPPLEVSGISLALGGGLFLALLVSDITVHGLLSLLIGQRYGGRLRELAAPGRPSRFRQARSSAMPPSTKKTENAQRSRPGDPSWPIPGRIGHIP
jgi:hypothetical protein